MSNTLSQQQPTISLATSSRRAKPISLTALIDVVFILLMFFMLTSSFSQWQAVELKTPNANSQVKNDTPPVVIIYENDLGLLTDTLQRPILLAEIKPALKRSDVSLPIILSGEKSVSVQRLVNHYEALKTLGFRHIQIGATIGSNSVKSEFDETLSQGDM